MFTAATILLVFLAPKDTTGEELSSVRCYCCHFMSV